MTQPQTDTARQTQVVPINGRSIVIRQLVDTQMFHLLRHARIMEKDDVDRATKLDSVEKIFTLLHRMVVQPSDLEYLIEQEESGNVELKDLLVFMTSFQDQEPEKPKVRRGRPPAKRA